VARGVRLGGGGVSWTGRRSDSIAATLPQLLHRSFSAAPLLLSGG